MDPLNFAGSGKQAFPLRRYRNWASGASFATDPTPRLGAAVKAPNPPKPHLGSSPRPSRWGFSEFSEKVFASLQSVPPENRWKEVKARKQVRRIR